MLLKHPKIQRFSLDFSAKFLVKSCGFFLQGIKQSVWIHGESPEQFDSFLPVMGLATENFPQFRLVLTSSFPATVRWLKMKFLDDTVCPSPFDLSYPVRRFFKSLSPAVIVLLASRDFPRKALITAVRRQIPLVFANIERKDAKRIGMILPQETLGSETVHFCAYDEESAVFLKQKGIKAERISVTGIPEYDVFEKYLPLVPAVPPVEQSWRARTWGDVLGQSRLWRRTAPVFMRKRIDDWDTLRFRLGRPKTILCLGNGPSAEDPRLKDIRYDCLMRVNWKWLKRGVLTDPQVVFIGDHKTLRKFSSCVYGIWNIDLEFRLVLLRLLTRGPRAMEYFTMERISSIIREKEWSARPSNGALMVAAGAALEPEKLVISGMDLFSHPLGRYPGDFVSRNQYAHVHKRQVDLAIIHKALQDYAGELIIFSDALRVALDSMRKGIAVNGD